MSRQVRSSDVESPDAGPAEIHLITAVETEPLNVRVHSPKSWSRQNQLSSVENLDFRTYISKTPRLLVH